VDRAHGALLLRHGRRHAHYFSARGLIWGPNA
jgi:hypothetical protein